MVWVQFSAKDLNCSYYSSFLKILEKALKIKVGIIDN